MNHLEVYNFTYYRITPAIRPGPYKRSVFLIFQILIRPTRSVIRPTLGLITERVGLITERVGLISGEGWSYIRKDRTHLGPLNFRTRKLVIVLKDIP